MALIKCSECGREISDKAESCPGCGAPASERISAPSQQPTSVRYDASSDSFTGTMVLIVKLAMRAVQALGWKIDQANETLGMVTFQTGISWGSWSGVSCSLNIEENVSEHLPRQWNGQAKCSGRSTLCTQRWRRGTG